MKLVLSIILFLYGTAVFSQCDSIPPLNKDIIRLVDGKMKKKVGAGECWDLAKYVLDETGAKWDGAYKFGKELLPGECVLPGDIIQFEKVKIKYKKGKETFTESMPHHTAIVYKRISDDEVELAHQNTGYSGKKVGVSSLRFSTIIAGKYKIYRPVK